MSNSEESNPDPPQSAHSSHDRFAYSFAQTAGVAQRRMAQIGQARPPRTRRTNDPDERTAVEAAGVITSEAGMMEAPSTGAQGRRFFLAVERRPWTYVFGAGSHLLKRGGTAL